MFPLRAPLTPPLCADTDPARRDSALARRLRENREVALTRLDSVVSRYAQLQDESEEEERVRKRAAQARGSTAPRQEGLLPPPCPMAPDPGEGQSHTQVRWGAYGSVRPVGGQSSQAVPCSLPSPLHGEGSTSAPLCGWGGGERGR